MSDFIPVRRCRTRVPRHAMPSPAACAVTCAVIHRVTQGIVPRCNDSQRVGELAARAALLEAGASPKPGLVCPNSQGAHTDMDYSTFVRSALALQPYFAAAHALGKATSRMAAHVVFLRLRTLGVQAEQSMYTATHGVNTHKGLIFSMGLFCAALGRLEGLSRLSKTCIDVVHLCATAASLAHGVLHADMAGLPCGAQAGSKKAGFGHGLPRVVRPQLERLLQRRLTPGETIYVLYGCGGVRAEVEQGFPHAVLAWRAMGRHGLGARSGARLGARLGARWGDDSSGEVNRALTHTLLELVARMEDSSVLWRGGLRGLALARGHAARALALGGLDSAAGRAQLERMGAAFVRRRLSPGGCADMLAMGVFLHLLEQEQG